MKTKLGRLLATACLVAASARAQTLDVVHRFQTDGGAYGRLIQASDGNFYGTTSWGGSNGVGTIFRMDSSGAVTTMHSFGYVEGVYPKAALLQGADGNLYGTTSEGGTSNLGTIFMIDLAGSVTVLHSFNGPDGANPWASLIQTADGGLYGTTHGGGASNFGTVFKMDSTGNVSTLHSFDNTDGANPVAALMQGADGIFYGTTEGIASSDSGHCTDCGTVFRIDADGNLTTLHNFSDSSGALPQAALVQDADGNFYGTTPRHYNIINLQIVFIPGTVFKIDSSGNFSVIHTFGGGFPPPGGSTGGVILASDGNLYGTAQGGIADSIFRISPGGTFESLHSFSTPQGSNPHAGLVQASDGGFYGTTLFGGIGGVGTIYKMDSSNILTTLFNFPTEGISPRASLIQAPDGAFYGTTVIGGAGGRGTVFKTDSTGTITTLHSFALGEGESPSGALLRAADGNFYGPTSAGGPDVYYGTIFKMEPSGTLTTLHSFTGVDGSLPSALIQLADGSFYGTTQEGGPGGGFGGFGTVFKMNSSGTVTTLHSFDGTDGANPAAALILGADGNFYGTTSNGGSGAYGTVFKMDLTGNVTTLHSFSQLDGANPGAALLRVSDGSFYGTTRLGGANSLGTVFKMDSMGNVTTLHSFNGSDGSSPSAVLIQASDGNIYGTTEYGGTNGDASTGGTIFKVDPSGNLITLESFDYGAGSDVYAGLVLATDGSLWGTAFGGGVETGRGTVFRLILSPASLEVTSINPTSGPSVGGTPISIAGTGFEAGARVMIGDSPASAVTVGSSSAVSALAPALSPGTLNEVTVININASFGTAPKLWFADFLDVPQSDNFHADVEAIFRKGITAGHGDGNFGRDNPATRAQMAVFLLKAEHGSSYVPPACTGAFPDVPCPSLFADWIEQLAAEGITGGCGGDLYCPDISVTRRQMAVFLLKAKEGSSHVPPAATGIFGDVPPGDTYAPWIEELYNRGITGGCQASPLLYCPGNPSTRGQMAVFLVKTFGLAP